MGTGNIVKTDLYAIHNIVQNAMLSYPKDLFIETLREYFSQDSYYHYQRDVWGHPFIPNQTDLPSDAGINDDLTSRIYIGEAFHYNMKYYPAVLVRGGSFKYTPISMSKNEGMVHYGVTRVVDGYGNERVFSTPSHFIFSGAWEGQIIIDIIAGDSRARDELVEIVASMIEIVHHRNFYKAGVFIKPVSAGSPSEVDDNNEKLYKQTISCDIRTEWRQEIPINSVVDAIHFCVDFGNIESESPTLAPNLGISSLVEFIETI